MRPTFQLYEYIKDENFKQLFFLLWCTISHLTIYITINKRFDTVVLFPLHFTGLTDFLLTIIHPNRNRNTFTVEQASKGFRKERKKSLIRKTPNLLVCADSSTNTIKIRLFLPFSALQLLVSNLFALFSTFYDFSGTLCLKKNYVSCHMSHVTCHMSQGCIFEKILIVIQRCFVQKSLKLGG